MTTTKTELKKGELFVKEVLNRLTGDNTEALANKIGRKAISALQGQIAALDAKQIDDENAVEDAKEALNNAKFPTTLFTDNKAYCQNILNAQARVDAAEAVLKSTTDSIAYFTNILDSY